MIRLVFRFVIVVVLAMAFTWIANRPGSLSITWLGYQIDEIPVYLVIGVLLLSFFAMWFAWWLIRLGFGSPGALGDFFRLRRSRKGLDALSKGMVAVGAGDVAGAQRQAIAARKLMSDSPLAHLLEAQAAQMRGDEPRVREIYTQMLDDPESEVVALRGLFTLARKSGDDDAARRHAERALRLNPALAWASEAVMVYRSGEADWPAAIHLSESQRKSGIVDRDRSNVLRAVVLTAQALAAETSDAEAAADLAGKAHKLDPSLIPAAVVAGRVLAQQGALRKAAKILETTWKLNPHPDIAEVYRHARMGDSTTDRLLRTRDLLAVFHGGEEGALALATAAVEALDWKTARNALQPYCKDRPAARICLLMAEIEQGEHGDQGRSREWLARAVRAPNNPAWTADGFVSEDWLPVSPTTGKLGVFEWKVPLAALSYASQDDIFDEEPEIIEAQEVIAMAPDEAPVDETALSEAETVAEPAEEI
ncbi:MAG: heme biosynthesis protein HemY, partial [Aestuariivirgaceae bacterium]